MVGLFKLTTTLVSVNVLNFPASLISDIDECDEILDNCAEDNAECTNTIGSFTCACDPGYSGDGTVCMGELVHNTIASELNPLMGS